ncbi:MAG: hypothetical protein M3N26_08540, partial [Pseudomonadota bacterium]|nr:hypothetical protein [Pseudomonadota bacterium]
IYAAELSKRNYLVEKLRRKFASSDPVFVIKCNNDIPAHVLESIHYQLYRLVDARAFSLLEVRADPSRVGQLDVLDRTLLRGYVSRFASYDNAEDADDASWHCILAQALSLGQVDRPSASAQTFKDIILPFPLEHRPSLTQVIPGDLRTGMVSLLRGNEWCRLIDDDVFRLHAQDLGEAATIIRWSGAHLPAKFAVHFEARSAIPESKAVRATLQVERADGLKLEHVGVVAPGNPGKVTLAGNWDWEGPVTVHLKVEPLTPLHGDARAVIDVQPIICRPDR